MINILLNADYTLTFPENAETLLGSSPLLNLMHALGFDKNHPPLADFLRQLHRLEGEWVICEPIYWEAGHNDAAIMATASMLQFSEESSEKLFSEVHTFLAEIGLTLHYHDAHTWLMRVDKKPELPVINSLSTQSMLHRSVISFLKDLDANAYWQSLMTELQMFMQLPPHRHLPVNGFWFYGYAKFNFQHGQKIFTDDARLIATFPANVYDIHSMSSLDANAVLLITQYDKMTAEQFAQVCAITDNRESCWYWNNLSYLKSRPSWLSRIFKRLKRRT